MIRIFVWLSIPFCMVGCATNKQMPKTERYQTEMTLHKMRADIEKIKHDLHTYQMTLNVIEGKVVNNEESLFSMKRETKDHHPEKWEHQQQHVNDLDHKCKNIEQKQDALAQQLHRTTSALSQHKDKITEIEGIISLHNQSLAEVGKIRDHLKTLALSEKTIEVDGHVLHAYRVQPGDSLDKIAKKYRTSSTFLRKVNHLKNDLILSGQELLVPYAEN